MKSNNNIPESAKFPLRLLAILLLTGSTAHRTAHSQDMPLSQVLIDGEGWELVADGLRYAEGLTADRSGTVYFADSMSNRILRIEEGERPSTFVRQSFSVKGMMFGPDGLLYACQLGKRRIVAYDNEGTETVIAEGVEPNDLAVNSRGEIYFSEPSNRRVWYLDTDRKLRVVDAGIPFPNGVAFWPDQGTLVVADTLGFHLWTFRIESGGNLSYRQPYYTLDIRVGQPRSGADGLAVDTAGRVYVTSVEGVQVFDTTGRLSGVLTKPDDVQFISSIAFGGPKRDTLYIACLDRIYRRKTQTTGMQFPPRQQPAQ